MNGLMGEDTLTGLANSPLRSLILSSAFQRSFFISSDVCSSLFMNGNDRNSSTLTVAAAAAATTTLEIATEIKISSGIEIIFSAMT